MHLWAVIAFDDENSVATIPSTWLWKANDGKDMCYWPSKTKNVTGYVKRREEPAVDWEQYAVTILGNNYASYEMAVKKALKAEEQSDLSSTSQTAKRKRIQNRFYLTTPVTNTDMIDKSGDSEREECTDDDYPKLPKQARKLNPVSESRSNKENKSINMGKKHTEVTPKPNSCSRDQDDSINDSTPLPKCSNADNFNKSRCDTPDIIIPDGHSTPTSMKSIGGNSTPRFVTSNLNKNIAVDDKEFKRQVLTKLNIIIAKLSGHDEQFEAINNLLENFKPTNGEEETPATGLELLPVNNDDSLAVCEQFLSDRINLRKLARELSRMGGTTVPEMTRKLLYKIITNEFAELYSWEGGKGKRKFINVTLSRLVIDSVQCNKRTQNACEDEIIQEIKRWLAKAKERVKNELKKTERSQNQQRSQDTEIE